MDLLTLVWIVAGGWLIGGLLGAVWFGKMARNGMNDEAEG